MKENGHDSEEALKRLSDLVEAHRQGRTRPPIEQWHPDREVDIDIRVARNGRWFFQGREMQRHELVCLFYSILRREGADYFLVTPVEKARIRVEDVPAIIVDLDLEQTADGERERLRFTTQYGDHWDVGTEHPLFIGSPIDAGKGETDAIYCYLDRGLFARLDRPVYYRMSELIEQDADGNPYIRTSRGAIAIQPA